MADNDNVGSVSIEITADVNAQSVANGVSCISSNIARRFQPAIQGVGKQVNSLGDKFKGLGSKIVTAFSVVAVTAFTKKCIEASASVNALNSQFEQTFSNFKDNAYQSIQAVAKESGILESRLQSVGTSIYAFAKTTGMDSVTALNLMQEALQVTADSAAYYDRSLEDTAESLKSFLKGNYENDSALGLSCTETTRNAMANRLYSKSFNELSESQKQLTLLQMVKDANKLSGAMGQASREADGWENVIGNLKEAWKQLLSVVGQPVLKVATQVVKQLTISLQVLTEYAQQAINTMSKLFGWDLDNQTANAISVAGDNVNSLATSADDATKNLKKTEKTAKELKNSLSGFDKLNVLSQENDEIDNEESPKAVAEIDTSNLSNAITDIEKNSKLKLSINIDFEDLGKKIMLKINQALSKIDWNKIKGKASELGKKIADFFNGAVEGDILGGFQLGKTLGEGINTAVNFAYSFLTTFDFKRFGTDIAGNINKAISTVDWGKLGQTLGAYIQSFISTAFGFITTFDFKKFAKSLSDAVNGFINEIDWGMFAYTLSSGLLGLWDLVVGFFENLDYGAIGKSIGEFIIGIDWIGIIEGPLKLLWDMIIHPDKVLGDIGSKLWDFWVGLLDGLGVTEYWTNLILNAWDGIKKQLSGVKTFFQNIWKGITNTFSNVTNWFKNTFSNAWQSVKDVFSKGGEIFNGIKDGILNSLKCVINGLIDGINTVISIPFNGINTALEKIKGIEIAGWKPFEWITTIQTPQIPKLATGGIVKAPTLALVGDNAGASTGNPEVVAPLNKLQGMLQTGDGSIEDTAILSQILQYIIKLYEAVSSSGSNIYEFIAQIDGKVLFEKIIEENNKYKKRHNGRSAFV